MSKEKMSKEELQRLQEWQEFVEKDEERVNNLDISIVVADDGSSLSRGKVQHVKLGDLSHGNAKKDKE